MQDYVRTGTYQRAILQNHTDFKDKVTNLAAALNIRSVRGSWLPTEIMIWTSGKKKSLDRWQIKLQVQQQTIVSVCLCDCALSCLSLCARAHARPERNRSGSVWAGQFDVHFYYRDPVCMFVCRRGLTPPFLLSFFPAGGLGCRLWLRDPLLLCSPSWSQEGLCCRGQYYGTARRGTHPSRRHWQGLAFSCTVGLLNKNIPNCCFEK